MTTRLDLQRPPSRYHRNVSREMQRGYSSLPHPQWGDPWDGGSPAGPCDPVTVTATVDPNNSFVYHCTVTPYRPGLLLQWIANGNSIGDEVPIVAPGVATATFTEAVGFTRIDAWTTTDPGNNNCGVVGSVEVNVTVA